MNNLIALDSLQNSGCEYAFYFQPAGRAAVIRSNCQRFSSASIIKVPILLAWVHLERQGLLDRTELCCLDDEPQVQGAGFSWLLQARRLPYQDVLLMMIALSDNLCTNLILRRMGLERLQKVLREDLKLPGSEVQRKLMDYEARARGLDNWITATDCMRYFDLVEQLTPAEKAWVEPMLLANQDGSMLMRDLPRDELAFYHKTGCIPHVFHDWGYTRTARIFLLTQQVQDEALVNRAFGELGQMLISPTGASTG